MRTRAHARSLRVRTVDVLRLYSHGLHSYDLYGYGLHSHGLYSHGLHS